MIEIYPTVVPDSFDDIIAAKERYGAFASGIHVDLADGAFAPRVTWQPKEGDAFPDIRSEAHLMTREPLELGIACVKAGAVRVIGHVEAFDHADAARSTMHAWRELGVDAGLGVLLLTPLSMIDSVIGSCTSLHLMSIATIGSQGIPYDDRVGARIEELHKHYPEILISVDGGVDESNIGSLFRAGARRFGVGSALARAEDPALAYNNLKSAAENAINQ